MSQALPSLELIADLILAEREGQLKHVESLDNKAGIVLGFAGAVVALGSRSSTAVATAGTIAAAVCAASAVWAFLPRAFPVIEARSLRDRYLRAELSFTRIHVVDTIVQMIEESASLIRTKSRRLRLAMSLLVVATVLLAADIL